MRIALRNIAITLAALLVLIFAFVQFQQHLLRHRAEQLFNDVQAFQLHPANFADLQKFQQQWGSRGHYDGVCTIEHCVYQVILTDAVNAFVYPNQANYRKSLSWLASVYDLIGRHSDGILTTVRLHDDRIWGTDYNFYVFDGGFLRESIHFGPHLFVHGFIQSDELRNGYAIDGASNIKEALDLHISSQTSPTDIKRLSVLNFDCITRIKPCLIAKDIIPAVANDPLRGRDLNDKTLYLLADCEAPTALFAREAENIVEIEVRGVQHIRTTRTDEARVRILRQLKNAQSQAVGSEWEVNLDDENLGPQSASSSAVRALIAGRHYLLLFPQPFSGQTPGHLYLEPCSAYPATDSVASEIRKGIAMDTSGGEPLE